MGSWNGCFEKETIHQKPTDSIKRINKRKFRGDWEVRETREITHFNTQWQDTEERVCLYRAAADQEQLCQMGAAAGSLGAPNHHWVQLISHLQQLISAYLFLS